MVQGQGVSLWSVIASGEKQTPRWLWGAENSIALEQLFGGSSLGIDPAALRGRCVVVATQEQIAAALALIELDSVASRLVICPPDLPREHLRAVATAAKADAILSDRDAFESADPDLPSIACSATIRPADIRRSSDSRTEWVLLTSGTTGVPKLVSHTLSSLTDALRNARTDGSVVWSTFYDIRRYGGLQIFLRALHAGTSMVLSSLEESVGDFLVRAGGHGVTHISGTPSHWRRALMSPSARRICPAYLRLSGEIADQPILDNLRTTYPTARIEHAFASTEAGVAFAIGDGLAGFPASLLAQQGAGVDMKVEEGSLRIRSTRTATRYLGDASGNLLDKNGFVNTGDMVERRGDRYYFVGRQGGIVNVGGLKVHPEEVEAVINRHPSVHMSLVQSRKNPITGAVVVANVVLDPGRAYSAGEIERLKTDILETCRRSLSPHKVPVAIRIVPSLDVGPSGKLARSNA
jgi:acyl-coenzyme A synthetase/AMP-(fatty) acid ligase